MGKSQKTGMIMVIIAAVILIINGGVAIVGRYQLNKDYFSYWSLSDKSSTIEQKTENIDKFVNALENSGFSGKHNALVLTTPDNSFDENMKALTSLQRRLHEIQSMDIRSFEYQTAIQQITAQEQGEAIEMLRVFRGVWWKANHPLLWYWVSGVYNAVLIFILIVGIIKWGEDIW